MSIAFILFIILLLLCLVNYLVDLYFYVNDRFCRYHIGRWEEIAWENAVEDRAVNWLRRTPIVKITDNNRYILLDIMQNKYSSQTIQSWQKASLILSLLESKNKISISKAKNAAMKLIGKDGNWKKKPTRVDCGMLSYAIMQAVDNPLTIKPAMDETVSVIRQSINNVGLISYTGQRENPEMYVDTIGLCCPFLMRYAREYKKPEFESIAFRQINNYHMYGILEKTEIPNHAYSMKYKLPLGVYGWGRGIGWYVIGLIDSYEEVMNEEYKSILRKWIQDAANMYKSFRHHDGGFGAIIQSSQSYDSSATAALAWFYAKCATLFGCKDYYTVAKRCIHKLMRCTRCNGAIDFCQGDAKGIGIFSQTYDIMPFAQGMTLRAINELNNIS